jgi:hypothetical protein
MWKHNLTSIIEMLTVFHTVHMSIGERLASKFVILKTKNLVTCMLEDGYEEECKQFFSACRKSLHFILGVAEYVDEAV